MDVDTDDELLRTLASGLPMNDEEWPGLLSRLIPRLERIVHSDFPPLPVSSPPAPSQVAETSSQSSTASTQSTNKENAPPAAPIPSSNLHPQVASLLMSITSTLNTIFTKHPPHTIQRLAELILSPRQHYRTLPSYLHAVDRVVHVTSGAHIFPLPPAIPDPASAVVLSNGAGVDPLSVSWGNRASTTPQQGAAAPSTDESLGGALLTPILWLSKSNGDHSPSGREVKTESTEVVEGPNGPGGVETVSVSVNGVSSTRGDSASISPPSDSNGNAGLRAEGGITQGELLRQEQRAGVVPIAQLEGHRGEADGPAEEDELPHARGPEEIGMEDMGPQDASSASQRAGPGVGMQGIDVEAAVGRRVDVREDEEAEAREEEKPATPKREAEEDIGADEKRLKKGLQDQDTELADADGKAGGDAAVGEDGAVDTADETSV